MRDKLDLTALQKQGCILRFRAVLGASLYVLAFIFLGAIALNLIDFRQCKLWGCSATEMLAILGVLILAALFLWMLNRRYYARWKQAAVEHLKILNADAFAVQANANLPTINAISHKAVVAARRAYFVLLCVMVVLTLFNRNGGLSTLIYLTGGAAVAVLIIFQFQPRQFNQRIQRIVNVIAAQRDYEKANAMIAAAKTRMRNIDTHRAEAMLHYLQGDMEHAEAIYWQMAAGTFCYNNHPNAIALWLINVAALYMKQKRIQDALPLLEFSIHIVPRPRVPGNYLGLAAYYGRLSDPQYAPRGIEVIEAARTYIRQARRNLTDPDYFTLDVWYAKLLLLAGKPTEALSLINALYAQYTAVSTLVLGSLNTLAEILTQVGNTAAGAEVYRYVQGKDPNGATGREAAEHLAALTD